MKCPLGAAEQREETCESQVKKRTFKELGGLYL